MEKDIEALTKLIELVQAPTDMDGESKPFVLVRSDQKIENLEGLLIKPVRKVGCPKFIRAASFCEYLNQQKTAHSRLYIPTQTQFVCVLDHHESDEGNSAGWGQHRASLDLKLTQEWETWLEANTCSFGQRDFAQFIEDNSDDIADPAGADLLDMVRTLKATQNAEFNGVVDDKPGTFSAAYSQQTRTSAGAKGELELPVEFTLSIAPYEGGNKIQIVARLRFSIDNGKLRLHYELVKVQKYLDRALADISVGIEKAVEMTAWYGTPNP